MKSCPKNSESRHLVTEQMPTADEDHEVQVEVQEKASEWTLN